jgi:hypothetical protein
VVWYGVHGVGCWVALVLLSWMRGKIVKCTVGEMSVRSESVCAWWGCFLKKCVNIQ